MNRLFIPGIYRHFKGGRYVALALAEATTNAATEDVGPPPQLVIYRSLNAQNNGAWFAREKSEFLSTIEGPGVERFTLEIPFEPTNYREPDESHPAG